MNRTELMNVSEFAASLRVTAACIRRWILERRIAVVKVGRLVKIPKTEIDRVINAGLRPARPTQSVASKESR
jgi:excisionase family DNA binding protein